MTVQTTSNETVLILDDDPADANVIRRYLEEIDDRQIEVHHVSNWKNLFTEINRHEPAVLFLDHKLGSVSGLEMLTRLRSSFPYLPVVYLTGQGGEEVAKNAMEKGADDYLSKEGVDASSLMEAMEHACESREKRCRDTVTGLYRSSYLISRMRRSVEFHSTEFFSGSFLLIGLEEFKELNNVLGREMGDQVLRRMGNRIQEVLDGQGVLARWSGGDFACWLRTETSRNELEELTEELVRRMKMAVQLNGNSYFLGAKIGIVENINEEKSPESLFSRADLAQMEAKGNPEKSCEFFGKHLETKREQELTLRNDFKEAVTRDRLADELVLYYQPQISLDDNSLRGFEALVRWEHPEEGLKSPGEFFPVIDKQNLKVELDQAVMDLACRQLKNWEETELNYNLSINVSPPFFLSEGFLDYVFDCIERHDVKPFWIEIEITEDMLVAATEKNVEIIEDLQEKGVHVSLDDFGQGYSSFSYLKDIPFDTLKIDRSLVMEIEENDRVAILLEHILKMGKELGLETIAEGVETPVQYQHVKEYGCDVLQGYLVSRPQPLEDVESRNWPEHIEKSLATSS